MLECARCHTVLLDELIQDEHGRLYCLECDAEHEQDLEYEAAMASDPPSNRWHEDLEPNIINPAKE